MNLSLVSKRLRDIIYDHGGDDDDITTTQEVGSSNRSMSTATLLIEKEWKSIRTEVNTILKTATPDKMKKLLIDTPKVNAGAYVCLRESGNFQAKIHIFPKLRTIGTFPNEEEATLAYAIAKNKLEPIKLAYTKARQNRVAKDRVEHNIGIDVCDCCKKTFSSKSGFWYHVKNNVCIPATEGNQARLKREALNVCGRCNTSFCNNQSLTYHVQNNVCIPATEGYQARLKREAKEEQERVAKEEQVRLKRVAKEEQVRLKRVAKEEQARQKRVAKEEQVRLKRVAKEEKQARRQSKVKHGIDNDNADDAIELLLKPESVSSSDIKPELAPPDTFEKSTTSVYLLDSEDNRFHGVVRKTFTNKSCSLVEFDDGTRQLVLWGTVLSVPLPYTAINPNSKKNSVPLSRNGIKGKIVLDEQPNNYHLVQFDDGEMAVYTLEELPILVDNANMEGTIEGIDSPKPTDILLGVVAREETMKKKTPVDALFMTVLENKFDDYHTPGTTTFQQETIASEIVDELKQDYRARFLRTDDRTGRWIESADEEAQKSVIRFFRDMQHARGGGKCRYCPKEFTSLRALASHQSHCARALATAMTTLLPCPYCPKQCRGSRSLSAHMGWCKKQHAARALAAATATLPCDTETTNTPLLPDIATATAKQESTTKAHTVLHGLCGAVVEDTETIPMGARLGIWWDDDRTYYPCTVVNQRPRKNKNTKEEQKHEWFLEYDDGTDEWLDLTSEQVCWINDDEDAPATIADDENTHQTIDDADDDDVIYQEWTTATAKRFKIKFKVPN